MLYRRKGGQGGSKGSPPNCLRASSPGPEDMEQSVQLYRKYYGKCHGKYQIDDILLRSIYYIILYYTRARNSQVGAAVGEVVGLKEKGVYPEGFIVGAPVSIFTLETLSPGDPVATTRAVTITRNKDLEQK